MEGRSDNLMFPAFRSHPTQRSVCKKGEKTMAYGCRHLWFLSLHSKDYQGFKGVDTLNSKKRRHVLHPKKSILMEGDKPQ